MTPQERFAENLAAARAVAGLTQDELADRCGLHRTAISLLERAIREPRLFTIIRLAAVLEVSTAQLCEGIDWSFAAHRFGVTPLRRQADRSS